MSHTDHLKGRRVLITGAAGFVGANFVRALLRIDAQPHCIVRPTTDLWRLKAKNSSVAMHQADVTDASAIRSIVERVEPEYVYNFATTTGHPGSAKQRSLALLSTIAGTANLLEALAGQNVRGFVQIGSSLVYGPSAMPHRESDSLAPTSYRGTAKAAASLVWKTLVDLHEIPSVELRLYSVYGPFEHPGRLIPKAVIAALHDGEIPITPPGYTHDRVFIEDVMEACLLAAKPAALTGEVINVGTGITSTNEEVIAALEKITRKSIRVRRGDFPPRSFDRSHWSANIEKAQELLDWRPRHNLEAGLRKTVDWFRENEAHYPG